MICLYHSCNISYKVQPLQISDRHHHHQVTWLYRDLLPSSFLDAACSISKLYTVEDSLIINGLLIGTGNPADLQNSNHLLLIELILVQDVLSRLSSGNLYFSSSKKVLQFWCQWNLKLQGSSSYSLNTI